jgi:general stress protein 26
MSNPNEDHTKIWDLIRQAHSALLVTGGQDGRLDSRPMGCLQTEFDDTLWLRTFRDSSKVREISHDDRVLVSYAKPADYTYVSLSGRAQLGPSDPELAILAVRVEEATSWTNAASTATYT